MIGKNLFFKTIFSLLLSLIFSYNCYSQSDPPIDSDPNRNWDGITHWSRYIVISPGFMGPNALPVPEIKKGIIENRIEFELSQQNHFSKHDKTFNLFSRLYIPFANNKIAIEFYMVPVEYFSMDTCLRYKRKTFKLDGEGFAVGDLYFSTIVQILKNHKNLPDIALRLACRTASGGKFTAARFTDTPGYFFDLSFGKKILMNSKRIENINAFGMAGFYSWQTYSVSHRQNDAFLFGFGADINTKKFSISNAVAGYLGYCQNLDKPIVYRFHISKNAKHFDFRIGYQAGLQDLLYNTINFSVIYHIKKLYSK